MQIARGGPKLTRFRQARERILFRDMCQRHRSVNKLPDSIRGQVAGCRRTGSRAQKHAQTKATRAGFLQRFHFAHAHIHAETLPPPPPPPPPRRPPPPPPPPHPPP